MVGITIYWKKFRAKQPLNEGQELEFREKQLLNEDDSTVFTRKEMMNATQNFSHIMERRDLASAFFGKLPDGKEIVVKVFSMKKDFLNEIDLISRVHHKNLPHLRGYCYESKEFMLIYDYMSEGLLDDRLYGRRTGLNWKTRLKIAIDTAEGLQYLHVCCTPMIIHRDVKSSNILLDSNLNGKLCAFDLSMMTMDRKTPIDTNVAGTLGYLDPEYGCTGVLTQKSDVYSFGVVLLEIICGRRSYDRILPEQEQFLPRWVKEYVGINGDLVKIVEIIDQKMDGKYDMKSITNVAKVALRCVEDRSSLRPSVSEVVGELKEAMMYEKLNNALVTKYREARNGVTI